MPFPTGLVAAVRDRLRTGATASVDRRPRPATALQQEILAAEGVDGSGLSEDEALHRLRMLIPDWDDHET